MENLINLKRYYYSDNIQDFISKNADEIIGLLAKNSEFAVESSQKFAWLEEIAILKSILSTYNGQVYFEYSIPRMGKRIDVLSFINNVIFVFEFKIGEKNFPAYARDQVMDYALDLKNFHKGSHNHYIAPILIASEAKNQEFQVSSTPQNDKMIDTICCNRNMMKEVIGQILDFADGDSVDHKKWEESGYEPTPTIIEAAIALYRGHTVQDISKSEAESKNLHVTTDIVSEIISAAKAESNKAICFVTGVPGAGKTLVGLNIATNHIEKDTELYSVFLSGNGPLVEVLREALARDKVIHVKAHGRKISKKKALSEVKLFIQNVHNFRDECLVDMDKAPIEHIALFDEAQRAWDLEQTKNFMKRRKGITDFNKSEPDFLISCLDRHPDWAVIVCLVGGGQEINTGEAGISGWLDALENSYNNWYVYISPNLIDTEYSAIQSINRLSQKTKVITNIDLHLSVPMRSFRAENVSMLVKQLLDLETKKAQDTLLSLKNKYPIYLTRDLHNAKGWIKKQARGTERYGIIVSSQAERLKPHAIFVKADIDPIHWFLDDKDDVRSSYYLEDVATEFHIQGLELDWACVTWDADFRFSNTGWNNWSFVGSKWQKIRKIDRQLYQKNAYRVLLTRARQGMVIVVPEGDPNDPTRNPEFYNGTYEYLKGIGFNII